MSGQTIKDVVIKIANQAGDTSGFTSAMEAVEKDIQSVADQQRASMQQAYDSIRPQAIASTPQIVNQPSAASVAQQQSSSAIVPQIEKRPMFSPTGGAAGVRERASQGTQIAMGIAQQHGLLEGLSDEHLAKMEAQLQKRAEAFVREQDQEVSAAERAYDREAAAAIATYSKIMKEKEAKQKASDKASDDFTKQKSKEDQKGKAESESAATQLAKRRQSVMDNDVANAVNDTNRQKKFEADQQVSEASASAAANANAAGMAIWGFGAAIKLWMITTREAEETANRLRQRDISDAGTAARRDIRIQQAAVDFYQQRTGAETNTSVRSLKNRPGDLERESALRSMESRDDITVDRKRELRSISERNAGHDQQRTSLRDELALINSKQYFNKQAREEAQKKLSLIDEKRESAWVKGKGTVEQSMNTPNAYGFLGRSKEQNSNTENLQLDVMRQRQDFNNQELATKKEIAVLEAQNRDLIQQKLQKSDQIYKVTRQQKQEAYESVRDHKEGMRQDAVGVGMSSYGEQARLRMLDAKLSRIKAQREAGEETETLLPHEMQLGKSNKLGTTEIDRQTIESYKKSPLQNLDLTQEQLDEKEEQLQKVNASPTEENTVKQMEGNLGELKTAVESANKAIEGIQEVATMVIEFERSLRDAIEQVKTSQQQRSQIMQPYLGD